MYLINDLSKGKRELQELLGERYTFKVIDGVKWICLDLGKYSVGILTGNQDHICVWHEDKIVESYANQCTDYEQLKELVHTIRLRYGDRSLVEYEGDKIPVIDFLNEYGEIDMDAAYDMFWWCISNRITYYIPDNYLRNKDSIIVDSKSNENICISHAFSKFEGVKLLLHGFSFEDYNGQFYYVAHPIREGKDRTQRILSNRDMKKLRKSIKKYNLYIQSDERKRKILGKNRDVLILENEPYSGN